MFIAKAYAQAADTLAEFGGEIPPLPETPSAGDMIMQNLMVIGILVFLFYILLILPQQKRFKQHSAMLNTLKKGDRIVTGGGLIGVVEKVIEDKDEVIINLGETKVTAVRSTIHKKDDPRLREKTAAAPLKDKKSDNADKADEAEDAEKDAKEPKEKKKK